MFFRKTDAIDDGFDIRTATTMTATTIPTQTVEAAENESIVLSCGRTEMPHNDVKWFFNGNSFFFLFNLMIPVFNVSFWPFIRIYILIRYGRLKYAHNQTHTRAYQSEH